MTWSESGLNRLPMMPPGGSRGGNWSSSLMTR